MIYPLPCPQQTHISNILQHLAIHIIKIFIEARVSIPQAHTIASIGTYVHFEVATSATYMSITMSISNTKVHRSFVAKLITQDKNEAKNHSLSLSTHILSPNPRNCIFTKMCQQVCWLSMVRSDTWIDKHSERLEQKLDTTATISLPISFVHSEYIINLCMDTPCRDCSLHLHVT